MRGNTEQVQPAGSRFGPLGFPIGHPFATDEGGNERERAAQRSRGWSRITNSFNC